MTNIFLLVFVCILRWNFTSLNTDKQLPIRFVSSRVVERRHGARRRSQSPHRGASGARLVRCAAAGSARSRTMVSARSLTALLLTLVALLVLSAAAPPSHAPALRVRRQLADDDALQPIEVCVLISSYRILPCTSPYALAWVPIYTTNYS